MPFDPQTGFLCDQNLGKLARWLRIMGFDTIFMPSWDEKLVAQALGQGRTILTRKRSLAAQEGFVCVQEDNYYDQIHKLQKLFDFKKNLQPFSRCTFCNTALEDIPHDAVKGLVPEYVYLHHQQFFQCNTCRRIYWPGSHIQRVDDLLKNMLR